MDFAVDQYVATSKTTVELRMRTVARHEGVIKRRQILIQYSTCAAISSPAFYE